MFKFYSFDIETYKAIFSFVGKFHGSDEKHVFEISRRRNDRDKLLSWLNYLQNAGVHMVGYNNLAFDYPIIHELMVNPYRFDHHRAYELSQTIISSQSPFQRGGFTIKKTDRLIPQIDLLKINHFDNAARSTRLKDLEFALRMESVEDLPFDFHADDLTDEQMDKVLHYNGHDVDATDLFLARNIHLIEMRQELADAGVLFGDVLNFSDVKIGEQYLVNKIGRQHCYSGSKAKQTFRTVLQYKNLLLPQISFNEPPFQKVHQWFLEQSINVQSGTIPSLETQLAGIPFKFGGGGVHGSVHRQKFESNDEYLIRDVDVSGMYVAVGTVNAFAPEHLGEAFVRVYKQLKSDRAQYKKGTAMNATLKLAGNGVYGKSNDPYSPFYDPKYTFTVTTNGQLQLLMLVESLSLIPGLRIIQANTDGITAYVRRDTLAYFEMWQAAWEKTTGYQLESVDYKRMWIRDVNNYIAEYTDGKMKRKGTYFFPEKIEDYDGYWNKDYSMMAVQKAADFSMRYGIAPEQALRMITNPFDFMIREKAKGATRIFIGDVECQRTVRYYVSTKGAQMRKEAPAKGVPGQYKRKSGITDEFYRKVKSEIGPNAWDERIHTKNKSKYAETNVTNVQSGWKVRDCSRASEFNWDDLDYDYYVEEVKKILIT